MSKYFDQKIERRRILIIIRINNFSLTKQKKKENTLMKNSLQKCNNMTRILQQLNSTSYARIFCTLIRFEFHRLTTMINFDATRNFVSSSLVNRKNLFTQKKKDVYNLMIINENSLKNNDEMIIEEIIFLTMTFQQHHEKFTLNIVRMINHDIVLEML